MSVRAELRKGWCPGALSPMESGDGLILRVRPRAGMYSVDGLNTIAAAASRFGSGEIDLTNRANLQLRGVSEVTFAGAIAALSAAQLLDDDVRTESVRNVVVDPLSGVDPTRAQVRDLARTLEDELARNPRLGSLPGKFGFSVSGTSEACVQGKSTDIMLASNREGGVAIFLDGDLSCESHVAEDRAVEAVTRLAVVFLGRRAVEPTLRRMRDAVAREGSAAIFTAASLEAAAGPARRHADRERHVGIIEHAGEVCGVGIGLPFGRIRAKDLASLSRVAVACGIESANSSPDRVLIFPVAMAEQAEIFLKEARNLELITEPHDPRLSVDVCPGAPACHNATTDTRQDTLRLIEALGAKLGKDTSLHVSGCEKGCARRGAASLTLVARNGRYDLIRDDGPGGPVVAASLAPEDVAQAAARVIKDEYDDRA